MHTCPKVPWWSGAEFRPMPRPRLNALCGGYRVRAAALGPRTATSRALGHASRRCGRCPRVGERVDSVAQRTS